VLTSLNPLGNITKYIMNDTGILVYVPDSKSFIDQFWGLYYSVQYSKKNRTKFSFVIMCKEGAKEKLPKDNCVYFVREKEMCEYEGYQYKYSGHPYKYINSWYHFFDEEVVEYLRNNFYNLLRIDVDTFVTPIGNHLGVLEGEIKVGQGGYASAESTENLKKTCENLGIPFIKELHNIGSTWFGGTKEVIDLGQHACKYAKHLLNEDEVFKVGEGKWPKWYAGVITMYAGHLAACKCGYTMIPFQLDAGTAGDILWDSCYTSHCWHTREYFSKFQFADGFYDEITVTKEDWEKSRKLCDYAGWCAQEGRSRRRDIYKYTDEEMNMPLHPQPTFTFSDDITLISIDLQKQNIKIEITENGKVHIHRN